MTKTLTAVIAALSLASLAVPAAAAINARQLNQERNIDAGVRSGKLTRAEARTLRAEVDAIERQKERFTMRGGYSAREKQIIHARQDALARHIDRLKMNGRRR